MISLLDRTALPFKDVPNIKSTKTINKVINHPFGKDTDNTILKTVVNILLFSKTFFFFLFIYIHPQLLTFVTSKNSGKSPLFSLNQWEQIE